MTNMKFVTVEIIKRKNSDLFIGTSEQMKGLYVHGRSVKELEARIPGAIKEVLEAEGKVGVKVLPVADEVPDAFISSGETRKFALAA